uniref:CHAP domain-containing protein n=1 Tax=Eubacterium cellulosolvens TaxID=29322 RepID=UPI000A461F59|nr:CHAP domain-containing protein [[Eubacterium] cellulosolvens]
MRKRILVVMTAIVLTVSSIPMYVSADTDFDISEMEESVGDEDAAGLAVICDGDEKDTAVPFSEEGLYGTDSRTGGFVGGYTLTGNGAADILSVARAQLGRGRKDFGYREEWCADFVHDCAQIAGQGSAIPADGLIRTLREAVLKAGGTRQSVSRAQPGDLVIFDWPGDDTRYDHIEIFCGYSGGYVSSIGGNTTATPGGIVANNTRTTACVTEILRPNYKKLKLSQAPVLSGQSLPPSQMKKGTCFEIFGNIICKSRLTEVTVYVYDENGNRVIGTTVHPRATYFDLKDADDAVDTSRLSNGNYEYRVTATVNSTLYRLCSKTFCVVDQFSKDTKTVAMYRLYNARNREHFYTASAHERDVLSGKGWKYEGVGWYAPEESCTPVFRLYNPTLNDHHYTTNSKEREVLTAYHGWIFEGIGWYSDDNKSLPLYRCFCPFITSGSHLYTTANNETQHLKSVGWKYEGIAWYGAQKDPEKDPEKTDEPVSE